MKIYKKNKRYLFKEDRLEVVFFFNVDRITNEEADRFIRVFARSFDVPPNRLIPDR
jgi:hypothetical protein